MTSSSGTFAFNPAASDIVINAFSRCGPQLRGAALTAEHLNTAAYEANEINIDWGNLGYNLWKQETIQIPSSSQLTEDIFQYVLPATTLTLTLAWVETGTGANTIGRVLGPLSAIEYKAITNKLTQGPPNTYWYDRQITPVVNLWPVPDLSTTYTLFAQAFTQIQDVVLPGGVTLDVPYRFISAFTAELAARLAAHYAPTMVSTLDAVAARRWQAATTADVENRPLVIMPDLSGYYRP